jgi:hypothetical protein
VNDVRYPTLCGLNLDIASGPKRAMGLNRSRGRSLAAAGAAKPIA